MEADKDPLPVRIKYYTTLSLGLLSCLSCFVFMFMVPFYIEPSISTLIADFDPDPVICRTVFAHEQYGNKNCSWSSCKEGCTIDQYNCTKIYVDYMMEKYGDDDEEVKRKVEAALMAEKDLGLEDKSPWAVRGVPIFINIKACGYPPTTNCTTFNYNYASIGSFFECYYSRADPYLVITSYSKAHAIQSLVMALILPNLLTGVSLGILSYWWYPGCQRFYGRTAHYELPPDQEAPQDNEDSDEDEKIDKASEKGSEKGNEKGSENEKEESEKSESI